MAIDLYICVNNYIQMQGINSVVDQFILNRDKFYNRGVKVECVFDSVCKYVQIPHRKVNKMKTISKIKKTFFFDSRFVAGIIFYFKFYLIGKKAANNVTKAGINSGVILFQDIYACFFYLKKTKVKPEVKIMYMSHAYEDELEQFLMYYPSLKKTWIEKNP